MKNIIKVLIIDDHPLYRKALLEIVGGLEKSVNSYEAASISEALESISSNAEFDLVLLDLNLPDANGLMTLLPVCQSVNNCPVVIISANSNKSLIIAALNSGARGYIHKSCSNDEIRNALTFVLNGGTYIPSEILEDLSETTVKYDLNKTITRRQDDVLQLMAKGMSNKEISQQLGIAETTVRVHVSDIIRHFQAHNRTDAVLLAQKFGFVSV
jgi:DNA-binding NarL/FixJ family response regulator